MTDALLTLVMVLLFLLCVWGGVTGIAYWTQKDAADWWGEQGVRRR